MDTQTHLALIVLLPLVRERGSDDFTGVFNHHLPVVNVALTEQTSPMNPGPAICIVL